MTDYKKTPSLLDSESADWSNYTSFMFDGLEKSLKRTFYKVTMIDVSVWGRAAGIFNLVFAAKFNQRGLSFVK